MLKADRFAKNMLKNFTESSNHPNPLSSNINKISVLITLEKLEANLFLTCFSILQNAFLDAENTSLVKVVTRKILHPSQVLLSKKDNNE